ncbi:MAG: hypothetical protein ABI692_03230 [Terracoccus sp.]
MLQPTRCPNTSLEEKPPKPKTSYGVPDLYFHDNGVIESARTKASPARGEYEITEGNRHGLAPGRSHGAWAS